MAIVTTPTVLPPSGPVELRVDVLEPSSAPDLAEMYAHAGLEVDGGDVCKSCGTSVGIPLQGDEDRPGAVTTVVLHLIPRNGAAAKRLLCEDCATGLLDAITGVGA